MPNMSYCRFRNTKMDLEDCVYTLSDLMYNEEEPLSPEEKAAADRMYEICQEYIERYEDLYIQSEE